METPATEDDFDQFGSGFLAGYLLASGCEGEGLPPRTLVYTALRELELYQEQQGTAGAAGRQEDGEGRG